MFASGLVEKYHYVRNDCHIFSILRYYYLQQTLVDINDLIDCRTVYFKDNTIEEPMKNKDDISTKIIGFILNIFFSIILNINFLLTILVAIELISTTSCKITII